MSTCIRFDMLKAGDEVYVVPQSKRKTKPEPYHAKVTRVGRKYGYVVFYSREAPFHLATGCSAHKESNERVNCWGFDVWESREAYEAAQHEAEEARRLRERLVDTGSYSRQIKPLPPHVVQEIHEVLDRWQESDSAKEAASD